MRIKFSIYGWLLIVMASLSPESFGQYYTATRLNGGQPIIDQGSFSAVDPAFAAQGSNINGPSVIRIPDWIPAENRADPAAVYYCYFGDHGGTYIRMAWAADVEGPYTLYNVRPISDGLPNGVLDLRNYSTGENRILLSPTPEDTLEIYDHISSPEVLVDHDNQRIVLYFHGPTKHNGVGGARLAQKTFVTFSGNGLDFNNHIQPVSIGLAYLRVFNYGGGTYGIASRGNLYTAPADPFAPADPENFDYSRDLWTLEGSSYTDTPFQSDIDADLGGPDRIRHVALRVDGDTLEVFHSRVGDAPERILLTTIDLSAGAASNWDPAYPPSEVLWPEEPWEGINHPASPSSDGASINVRELRDPYVFEDADGKLYLFYTGQGEEAIGVAALTPSTEAPEGPPVSTPENEGIPVDGVITSPALSGPDQQISVETTLQAIQIGSEAFTRIIGVDEVEIIDNFLYFFQDVDPGSAGNALKGLSLTTATANTSAKVYFDMESGISRFSSFLIVEIGGDDAITLYPIDSQGNDIGTYRMTISHYGDVLLTAQNPNRSGGGTTSNPHSLHGARFRMDQFSGSGNFDNFAGFRLDGHQKADPVLIAAILTFPVIEDFTLNGEDTFEIRFQSFPGNLYEIQHSHQLLPVDFQPLHTLIADAASSLYEDRPEEIPLNTFYRIREVGGSSP